MGLAKEKTKREGSNALFGNETGESNLPSQIRYYTLDNGDVVSAEDVAKKKKLTKSAAYRRLQLSNKAEDVYAKKGKLMTLPKAKAKPKPKVEDEIKPNTKQRYEKMCRETKPFYVDKLYRLMFKAISAVGKK